jgi:hypothetical protein
MKKSIIMSALSLVLLISSAFANNFDGVSDKALQAFKKEFSTASDVNWQITKHYVKATFSLNSQVLFAYYSPEGERLAVMRNITSAQLPLTLFTSLKKSHADYWISDLFEVTSENEVAYYVTLENADQKITLRSWSSSGWEVYKKKEKI